MKKSFHPKGLGPRLRTATLAASAPLLAKTSDVHQALLPLLHPHLDGAHLRS